MLLAILIAGVAIVYFVPTIAAFVTKHPQKVPIFLLNFFAGWTLFVLSLCALAPLREIFVSFE